MTMIIGRRWPAIDVNRLYAKGNVQAWNRMLRMMYDRDDVEGLKKTLYGVQAGMADAAKAGPVTDEMANWFIRLQRSLELTAKKMFRRKYPHPLDNPLNAGFTDALAIKKVKQKRDESFEQFLKDTRF